MAEQNLKKFLSFFNLKIKTNKQTKTKEIVPTDPKTNKEYPFTPETRELYDFYLKRLTADSDSWDGRNELYDDCDQMYLNNPIIARNIKTLVFETLQRDLNDNPVKTHSSNPKTVKRIQDLFDRIKLNDIIQDITFQIVHYGNSLLLLSYSEGGISKAIPVKNIRNFSNRIEFNIADVKNFKKTGTQNSNSILAQAYSNFDRMEYLINSIEDKTDESDEFVDYLLGYEVSECVYPAWRGIHFRYKDVVNPFVGFGTPYFINAISPHMQYVNAMILQAIARTLRIPTDVYKLTMGEGMSPTEKLKRVVQFMAEFQNSGIGAKKKDVKGVGDIRYTIDGLYEWSQQTPEIDLGQIGDIELLRDDVIVAGILPKEWIDPRESGWGDSGAALKEKSKPFQRAVYAIQSVLLEGLTLLAKLDIIESGEDLDDHPFMLSLPFPQSQTNSDLISVQKDQIDLATSIIDTLSDKLSGGDSLPDDLVYDIYRQFLPYDDQKIEDWYNKIKKYKNDTDSDGGSDFDSEYDENRLNEKRKKIKESLKKYNYRNIQEAINSVKNEVLIKYKREGIFENSHFYSSYNTTLDFDPYILYDYKVDKIKKLSEKSKNNLTEEDKFDFLIEKEYLKLNNETNIENEGDEEESNE